MPRVQVLQGLLTAATVAVAMTTVGGPSAAARPPRIVVTLPASAGAAPLDGRLLVMLSKDPSAEPRFQIDDTVATQAIFGLDVEGWVPGRDVTVDAGALGYPVNSLADLPAGTYTLQALLHRYETFTRSDGHVVKLPMDRGEGQQWNRAPGNRYSAPASIQFGWTPDGTYKATLDQVIPEIAPPKETRFIKHERIQSDLLSEFWGRPMHLGAHVLLPEGWDTHPEARYPLVVNHGHFSWTMDDFREEPPDPNLKCEHSARFKWECYNRTVQEYAHRFYKDWTGPGFPRFILVEIQHANPYYDDSYAVNSENLGPYGDAIVRELLPYLERKYRGIGQGWARFMYGGSTGGWEALAAQVFYPDEFNGAFAACPDPIDFRAYTTVDLYEDTNAYYTEGPLRRVAKPGYRNYLGHVITTVRDMNRLEAVLGSHGRSGGQWDIWQAVFSPVGPDGYPKAIWDKETGAIDRRVAEAWREKYDLSHVLRRDWDKGLGRRLEGKLHLYVGDMDNYYLNNAVYLVEEFLKQTRNPPYGGEVDYGDRAEHCWNGDHAQPNAISRLRYAQMFAPKIVARILRTAPEGADVRSWRY
jgi:hypothetical protein